MLTMSDGASATWTPKCNRRSRQRRTFSSKRRSRVFEAHGCRASARHGIEETVDLLFDAGIAEVVNSPYQVSSSVRLISTPGRTAGHVSVVVESAGRQAVVTGGISHH